MRVTDPPRTVPTRLEHDQLGNTIAERWANGNTVVHAYDGLDLLVSSTDDATTPTASAWSRSTSRTTPLATTTARLVGCSCASCPAAAPDCACPAPPATWSERAPVGHVVHHEYDTPSRRVRMIDPEPMVHHAEPQYDDTGNPRFVPDRRGVVTEFNMTPSTAWCA